MGYLSKVPQPQVRHTIQEGRVLPIPLIAGYPAEAQDTMGNRRSQHLQGQFRLGLEGYLPSDTALLPSFTVILVKLLLGQIEPPIQQGVPLATGVSGKYSRLTVLYLAQSTTPLASYSHRMLPSLGKLGAIRDPNPILLAQRLLYELPVLLQQLLILPFPLTNELLYRLNIN